MLSSPLPPETPVDCQRLILQRRSMHCNRALAVGKYVPAPYPQPVTIGTHELIEGALTQCEHHPSDPPQNMAPPHMGQGSVLAYTLQPAKKSDVNWRDANRIRFVTAWPVQSGPVTTVFSASRSS
jgi:hypothetical protein